MAALYHDLAYLAYLAYVVAHVGADVGAQANGLQDVFKNKNCSWGLP